MASPKRVPYANRQRILGRQRTEYFMFWCIGAAAGWPLAVVVARRM
jgi:hypothetical protein